MSPAEGKSSTPEAGPAPATAFDAGNVSHLLPLVALVVGVAFVAGMLASTDGHFVPQVVDLYLVCQYARAMAEGHAFHYNPGEAASTGATSLLHTATLALAHVLGARGEGLVAFAIAEGLALYVAAVALASRLGRLLGSARDGLLAGGLVAFGGPVVWGFLCGSDLGVFMLLGLWLLQRMLVAWPGGGVSWVWPAALMALARPEGLLVAAVTAAAWLAGAGRRAAWPRRLLALLPVAIALGLSAFYRSLTGYWVSTSVADKSLIANYGWVEGLALVSEYAVDLLRGLLLGFYPSQAPIGLARGWASLFFPPLGLLLVLLAVTRQPPERRTPVKAWLCAAALVAAAVTPNVFLGVHFQRYVLWVLPALLVLAALGLSHVCALLAPGDAPLEKGLYRAGGMLLLTLATLATLRFGVTYSQLAGDVYARDVAAADWIARHLPRGVAMANLATSVEYLTGHRNLNLHGVTTPAFFGNRTAEREAGVYEALERLPAAERPPYAIVTASARASHPWLEGVLAGPALFQTTTPGDPIEIYATRYELLDRGAQPVHPDVLRVTARLRQVDALDVCDTRDEAAHGYAHRSRLGHLRLGGTTRVTGGGDGPGPSATLADAGRAIIGRESFRVRTQPGRELIAVLRTADGINAGLMRAEGNSVLGIAFAEAGVILKVDGRDAGRQVFRPQPGWHELVLRIGADFITREQTELEVSGRYASFHWWFFQ